MSKTLYICYFGLRQPLVQTQVIPYLLELKKGGIEPSLLTFEPNFSKDWNREQIAEEKAKLAEIGLAWDCLPYHQRPSVPATFWDILNGAWHVRAWMQREKFDVLHCRIHVPMLMGALARKFSSHKPKVLFDIRGFFPEEYTDAGVWPENGWLYRVVKRVERWLMKEADGFVVLTEKAREILFPESKATGFDERARPVEVIPCCVDLQKFESANAESRREVREELKIGTRKVIAYVGSFGGWYLTDKMLDFFSAARQFDRNTFILILTQRDKEKIVEALLSRGFAEDDFYVDSVAHEEIPRYLSAADIAVSFIKACYSKLSSSPTKIAEYLAGGLPIVINRGIGDLDKLIEENKIGVIMDDFSHVSYIKALNEAAGLSDVKDKCRNTAKQEFEIEKVGGQRYRTIYKELLRTEPTSS